MTSMQSLLAAVVLAGAAALFVAPAMAQQDSGPGTAQQGAATGAGTMGMTGQGMGGQGLMMVPGMTGQGMGGQGQMMVPGMAGQGMGGQGQMMVPGMTGQGMGGQGQMMVPGMTGQGMGGQGQMMVPGMAGQGAMMRACPYARQMGPGMMGSGMMGSGMMGSGMMGPGMTGGMGTGWPIPAGTKLTVADVEDMLGAILDARGNPRLEIGTVEEADANTIVADIVTVDGSLVQRIEVDRRTGQRWQVN